MHVQYALRENIAPVAQPMHKIVPGGHIVLLLVGQALQVVLRVRLDITVQQVQVHKHRVHVDIILLLAHLAVPRRLLDTMHLVQVIQLKPRLVLDTMQTLVHARRRHVLNLAEDYTATVAVGLLPAVMHRFQKRNTSLRLPQQALQAVQLVIIVLGQPCIITIQADAQRVHVDTILLLAHLAVPRRLLDTMHLVQVIQLKPRLVLDTMQTLVHARRRHVLNLAEDYTATVAVGLLPAVMHRFQKRNTSLRLPQQALQAVQLVIIVLGQPCIITIQADAQRVHVDTILLLAHLAVPRQQRVIMHLVQVTQAKPRQPLDTMRQLVRVRKQPVLQVHTVQQVPVQQQRVQHWGRSIHHL